MPDIVSLSSCNEYIKCVTLVLQLSHTPNTHLIPPIIIMFIILPNYIEASVAYNSSMIVIFEQNTQSFVLPLTNNADCFCCNTFPLLHASSKQEDYSSYCNHSYCYDHHDTSNDS